MNGISLSTAQALLLAFTLTAKPAQPSAPAATQAPPAQPGEAGQAAPILPAATSLPAVTQTAPPVVVIDSQG